MVVVIGVIALDYRSRLRDKEINQIDDVRKDIIRLDSLQDVREKRMMDSLKKEISSSQVELKSIRVINQKLNQQNEKLDRLYNSIHADMPAF